jgi:hypothetical protein
MREAIRDKDRAKKSADQASMMRLGSNGPFHGFKMEGNPVMVFCRVQRDS